MELIDLVSKPIQKKPNSEMPDLSLATETARRKNNSGENGYRLEEHPGYVPLTIQERAPREIFTSGAERDTQDGKGYFYLLPGDGLMRVALVFEKGAKKYGHRNWEKGIPIERYMDSALRHSFQYLDGATDEDHLGHAAWNLLCALATEERVMKGTLPIGLGLEKRMW